MRFSVSRHWPQLRCARGAAAAAAEAAGTGIVNFTHAKENAARGRITGTRLFLSGTIKDMTASGARALVCSPQA